MTENYYDPSTIVLPLLWRGVTTIVNNYPVNLGFVVTFVSHYNVIKMVILGPIVVCVIFHLYLKIP